MACSAAKAGVAAAVAMGFPRAVCRAAELVGSRRDQTHLRDLLQALREVANATTASHPADGGAQLDPAPRR